MTNKSNTTATTANPNATPTRKATTTRTQMATPSSKSRARAIAAAVAVTIDEEARQKRRQHKENDEREETLASIVEHAEVTMSKAVGKVKPQQRRGSNTVKHEAEATTAGTKTAKAKGATSTKRKIAPKSSESAGVSDTQIERAAPITPKKSVTLDVVANKSISPQKTMNASSSLSSRLQTASDEGEISVSEHIKRIVGRAYRIIARNRGLAYGTPNSPIYGENTEASMRKALHAMGLGDSSANIFCDVGSGTGAPSIHVACEFPSVTSYGFELMGSRWWISLTILASLLQDSITREAASRVMLAHVDLTHVSDFGPCTHVFSFDTGFPQVALQAFAKALNASKNVRVLGSFQKQKVLDDAGYERLSLRDQVPMRMIGSSEGKTLMIYDVMPRSGRAAPSSSSTPAPVPSTSPASWDITRLYQPPTDSMLAPTVPHPESYSGGEMTRLSGPERYLEWVNEQVGLGRSTGVRTRSASSKGK